MSALSSSIEFKTSPMLSSLEIAGRPNHGSGSGSYYLPIGIFLRSTGPDTATVDWTLTLKASGSQVGSASWSSEACNPGLTLKVVVSIMRHLKLILEVMRHSLSIRTNDWN